MQQQTKKWGAALLLGGLPLLWVLYLLWQPLDWQAEQSMQVPAMGPKLSFGEHAYWYLWINIGTLLFPFLLSFDKKVHFYKKWRFLLPGLLMVGGFFLAWDVFFTQMGVWDFNPRYFTYSFLGLPLGEWLFFITVPYACVFIHECLLAYIPKDVLAPIERPLSWLLVLGFYAIGFLGLWISYTAWTFLLAGSFLLWQLLFVPNHYRSRFYLAYLISIFPFLLVNGILTGGFNQEPVVLYNNSQQLQNLLGFRCGSIPWDDFIYGFLLLFLNVAFFEYFKKKGAKLSGSFKNKD